MHTPPMSFALPVLGAQIQKPHLLDCKCLRNGQISTRAQEGKQLDVTAPLSPPSLEAPPTPAASSALGPVPAPASPSHAFPSPSPPTSKD